MYIYEQCLDHLASINFGCDQKIITLDKALEHKIF